MRLLPYAAPGLLGTMIERTGHRCRGFGVPYTTHKGGDTTRICACRRVAGQDSTKYTHK